MKQLISIIFASLIIFSCAQKTNRKENELLKKENDLLKREIEINKKEQEPKLVPVASNANQLSNKKLEFKTYRNSNRQFKIDYPSFLIMMAPPENGDGREFISDGGEVKLLVYSSYSQDESISDLYNQEIKDANYTITYKVAKSNWYVISGIDKENNKKFYKKVYYSNQGGGQVRTMFLEYPQTRQNDFDLIIPRLIQTFKDI